MTRPGRWRRLVVRPLVWALALLALAIGALRLFLDSDLARERARSLIAARVTEALGRPITIERADFSILPLSVELHGVVVPGDRPGAADFARVRRIRVDADFAALGESRLRIDWVEIAGLELALELRQDGDNIPRLAAAGGGGRRVDVSIGALEVTDSRVLLDERTLPLALAARGVLARFSGVGGTDLEGAVTAERVEVTLPEARPVELAMSAKARLFSDRIEISNARLQAPDFALRASGRVGWRDGTSVDLTVAIDASGDFVDRLGYLNGEIAGPVHAEGTFGWRRVRGSPRRGGEWGWRADVTSPALDLFGYRLEEIAGEASGDRGRAVFDLERGRFAGGGAHGRFEIELERPRFPARLDLTLAAADLDRLLARFDVPVSGLAGEVSGAFGFAFDLTDAERGQGDGELEILAANAPGDRVPAAGSTRVSIAAGVVELPDLELSTPGQEVAGSALIELGSGAGRVDLVVRSADLGELARLAEILEPGALWTPSSGSGDVALALELGRGGTLAEIDLDLAAFEAPGLVADRLTGRLIASERALERIDLEARRGVARLTVAGRVPLGEEDPTLALELAIESWPIEEARAWLPFDLPIAGPANGRLRLSGSTAALVGEAVMNVEPVTLAGVEAARLDTAFRFDSERVQFERASLTSEAGEIAGAGSVTLADGALDLELVSAGLDLARPPLTILDGGRLAGRLTFRARVGGTLEAPAGSLEGRVQELALGGESLASRPTAIEIEFTSGRLEAVADLGELGRLSGGGPIATDAPSRLSFRLESDRLDRWIELGSGMRVEQLAGTLVADLALDLAPDLPPVLEITIPELEFRLGERTVRALEPIAARADSEGLEITSLYLGLPGGEDELFVSGTVGGLGSGEASTDSDPTRLDLNLQASLDADWLAPWTAGLDLAGRIDGLARVRGTLERPEVSGQAQWSDGRFLPPSIPHTFDRIRALALFYADAVVLDRLAAEFAGGTVTASGRIDLPADGRELGYRFEAALRRVAPRWPAGWQLRGDGDLTLTSSAEGRQVRGELRLDRVWYLQDLDLSPAQLVQRLLARSRVDVAETDEFLSTTALAVGIRAVDSVRVRNNLARLSGDADLALRGTLARPVLFGAIDIEPGGTVTYGGNTYHVERARATFVNPARIDPLLDIVARARVDQYDVRLNVAGSLERLNTTFASDPPLPDLDILGLLATGAPVQGATMSEIGADPTAPGGSLAAEALLYGQAASLLTARVGRLFGFDQVQVRPLTTGDTVSTAQVTVGKRLSRELYVTYSIDPSSTAQQILQVEWRMTDNLVLVLTQNGNESYAVDARWESRF